MNSRLLILPVAVYAVLLAALSFVNGFFLPDALINQVMDLMKDYLGKIQFSFWGIFFNNLTAALILFLGGFLLALPSLFTYYINFLALGTAFHVTVESLDMKTFLVSIVPHGIFEIPAIMIAFILGTALALAIIRKLLLKRELKFLEVLKKLGMIFIFVVIPLLIIAAFVEVNITFQLIQKMSVK